VAVEIKVPSVGESVTEGTIARWLKKDGDTVRTDEPVFELETDKATGEVPAPASGRLVITVPAGETVSIGTVVGRVEEAEAAAHAGPSPRAAAEPRAPTPAPPSKESEKSRAEPAQPPREAVLSPAARRRAREAGQGAGAAAGGGSEGSAKDHGAIRLERPGDEPPRPASDRDGDESRRENRDADRPGREVPVHAPDGGRATRQRMSSIRRRIAERLVESQQSTATLTTFNEADLSAVLALRQRYKDRFKEKHGVGLGFLPFFVKACASALRAFPNVNAQIDGPDVVYHQAYHIGVAVSTERGLMVPVVRDADRLGFAEIEKRIAELAERARDGKIAVDDLQGGTFTITNGGVFGSLLSTPILNPPQTGILGMHAIQRRPVAVGDAVAIRPMMYLALSYDHRLVDGREAVLFLVRVKECVEDPERLLLEI
jgi:2-oxoglutarate dehydrogenase E2 component (dihydrolipoamide succinyltransferase)